jgi:hypothetical protein
MESLYKLKLSNKFLKQYTLSHLSHKELTGRYEFISVIVKDIIEAVAANYKYSSCNMTAPIFDELIDDICILHTAAQLDPWCGRLPNTKSRDYLEAVMDVIDELIVYSDILFCFSCMGIIDIKTITKTYIVLTLYD